jgi:hypothetical protein
VSLLAGAGRIDPRGAAIETLVVELLRRRGRGAATGEPVAPLPSATTPAADPLVQEDALKELELLHLDRLRQEVADRQAEIARLLENLEAAKTAHSQQIAKLRADREAFRKQTEERRTAADEAFRARRKELIDSLPEDLKEKLQP